MRRYSHLFALIGLSLLLTACSTRSLLILTDQYWKASELESPHFKKEMAAVAEKGKLRVKTVTVPYGPSASAGLTAALEKNRQHLVLLSPLYSPRVETLAPKFDKRLFLAFRSRPSKNVIDLVPDTRPAFEQAAGRIARYLSSADRTRSASVAAVFSDDRAGQEALAGLRAGFSALVSAPTLTTLQVAASSDRGRLRRFLEESQARGVALYVLAAPALDSYAFELLQSDSAPIVTVNWVSGATYSHKVLFTIEEDIPAAIMKILETMGIRSDNQTRVPWDVVAAANQ